MPLARTILRDLAIEALKFANTLAEQNVFSPSDWPVAPVDTPALLVYCARESKTSQARANPNFTTTSYLTVDARLEAATGGEALESIDELCQQVEVALLTDRGLMSQLQQVAGVETQMEVNSEGRTHVAQARMEFALEYYQGQEDYDAVRDATPIDEIAVEVAEPGGTTRPGIVVDVSGREA